MGGSGCERIHECVALVVVTYNSRALIADLVASLEPAFAGVDYQVIFTDNESTDGTLAIIDELAPSAKVVRMGRNAGYAAGINAGVAHAEPFTAVFVLNPDVRLGPDCVPLLLRGLRTPGIGIAVPRISTGAGNLQLSMRRAPSVLRAFGDALLGARRAGRFPLIGELVTDQRLYARGQTVDWAEGSVQLISAECWAACGGWDESFFLYSEETEFDLRARDAGFATRYVPDANVVHLGGESTTSPYLWTLLTANRVHLFKRRNGMLRTIPFWLAIVVRETSRALLGRRTSRTAVRTLLSPSRFKKLPESS